MHLELIANPEEIEFKFVKGKVHWCTVLNYCYVCHIPIDDLVIENRHLCNACSKTLGNEEVARLWQEVRRRYTIEGT